MQELETWVNQVVIAPLLDRGEVAIPDVHAAIKERVLQSYRNGQKAVRSSSSRARREVSDL
jgi:hypothetical protein